MPKIPPEIDGLMWAVAENPNSQAVLEFEARHPEYRLEMLKRVEMVRGLRTEAKGPSFRAREIPKFDPKPIRPTGMPRGTAVAVGLAFAAIAFAAFTATHSLKPVKPKALPAQRFDEVAPSQPKIVYQNSSAQSTPPAVVPEPLKTEPPAPQTPLAEKRRNLKLKDVDLVAALSLITAGTNIKLVVGPGFVNQKITLDFSGATTSEMLFQMAKDYAFTVSDEGNGTYLVLPVADNEPAAPPANNSTRRIGP